MTAAGTLYAIAEVDQELQPPAARAQPGEQRRPPDPEPLEIVGDGC